MICFRKLKMPMNFNVNILEVGLYLLTHCKINVIKSFEISVIQNFSTKICEKLWKKDGLFYDIHKVIHIIHIYPHKFTNNFRKIVLNIL